MSIARRGRFIWLLTQELTRKHTRSLIFGFLAGLSVSLIVGRTYPFLVRTFITPVTRIGVVGEFTPSTLPLSIQRKISFGLTEMVEDGTPGPSLASSWTATDSGKTYTFQIRNDLVWHDGKPVTAADVNYNINSVAIEAKEPYLLEAHLEDAYSPFPTLLTKPILRQGLVGFGRYKVSRIKLAGDKIRHMRLIPSTGEMSGIFEYRFYRTEALAILAYKLGDIDILEDITSSDAISDWGTTTQVGVVRTTRIVAAFFNLKDQLLSEKSIRQALGFALPVFSETPAYSPISAASWAYYTDVKKYEPSYEEAKRLFTHASVDPSELSLVITTFPQYIDTAQKVAVAWGAFGIQTSIKVENALTDQFQVLVAAQDIPPDPDQYTLWHSQQATNITGYVNLKVDKLLEDGRRELDQSKRVDIYHNFQKYLVEDAPAIFLYHPKQYTIYRNAELVRSISL